MTRALLLLLTLLAVSAHARTYLCGSEEEIQAALADINAGGKGGTIAILPGEYNLKSDYRKQLEADPTKAVIPAPREQAHRKWALYVTSPNVTICAATPGTVKLVGEATAIFNEYAPVGSQYRVHRGGMIHLDRTAANAQIVGLDIDGRVPPSPKFNPGRYCHKDTTDGVACWDWSHKAILSRSPNARIIDCKVHDWAGEMIYGGSQAELMKLEIRGCEIYNNQVSALSGTWQLKCHDNEFYNLGGQVMEGLHQYTCQYHDNYFHDCDGGGLNILGTVKGLGPDEGWMVDIRDNLFERMNSSTFGAVYLSKQTTPDVEGPKNIAIVGNTFRDCRTILSVSLGAAEQVHFSDNLVLVDAISLGDGIATKSGSLEHSLVRGNTWLLSQQAIESGARLNVGNLNTGRHVGTRFVGNYYERCRTPFDANSSDLRFQNETYVGVECYPPYQYTINAKDASDVPLVTTQQGQAGSTGVYGLMFIRDPLYLRLVAEDADGQPPYAHGTELRLQGYRDNLSVNQMAYLIDGRGCRLKDGWPVFFAGQSDYVLLRYDAVLKSWVEAERSTPRADELLRLSHRGLADEKPQFAAIPPLLIDGVNVIDAALCGWEYYETDTARAVTYTGQSWK